MVAGIVAASLRGLSLKDAARLATAFSLHALTLATSGENAREAVAAFAARVLVCPR